MVQTAALDGVDDSKGMRAAALACQTADSAEGSRRGGDVVGREACEDGSRESWSCERRRRYRCGVCKAKLNRDGQLSPAHVACGLTRLHTRRLADAGIALDDIHVQRAEQPTAVH